MNSKTELLLPAGSPEAFVAALEGGADAVYLGLQQFNARGRAKNFQLSQLPQLLKVAEQYQASLYITLNTLIKNAELPKVIEYLEVLKHYPPSALIIQDWGVFYLLRQYYRQQTIHASTQMGNHNSSDCRYAESTGFSRVILARELSLEELIGITAKSKIELEVFTHGALCYSFSGSCLFSSWSGGMSANRGQCRQPCRHQFTNATRTERVFSMKDLQLLEYLPDLQRLGIKAIKIEGRMRSADYVYKVAKAYRLALDNPTAIPEAKAMLVDEGGRDKTDWYFSGKSSFVTTGNSFTGKGIGVVISSSDSGIVLSLHADIKPGDFIRFQGEDDTDAHVVSIKHVEEISEDQAAAVLLSDNDKIVMIPPVSFPVSSGSLVYKINQTAGKQWQLKPVTTHLPKPDTNRVHQIAADIGNKLKPAILPSRVTLFFRISDPAWLPIIATAAPKAVLYPVYSDLNHKTKLRLIPELPYFTPEAELITLSRRLKSLIEGGCHSFAISRLSQRNLFKDTKSIQLFSNEQVYALNDAAVLYLQSQAIKNWILPLENDFPNLVSSKNRDGIVPLYFYPNLFFSRQPANVYDDHSLIHGKDRLKYVQDKGMVKVVPSKPICNFSFYTRLWSKGYSRFLIDLSYDDPDQGFMDNLLSHLDESKNLPDTTRFNMKQGLW